jgi:hypothetical protein
MNKLFYIKEYADNTFYCYHCDWTIKIIRLLGLKIMWIHRFGFSISAFGDKKQAQLFIKQQKLEYINAKKYIKL